MDTNTLAANMRRSFIDRKSAKIGGGVFTPEELRDGAIMLAAAPDLLAALEALIRMQVKGHDLIDRMQFSDEGRAISAQVMGAIAKAKGAA